MKRLAALAAALMMATGCGDDTPTVPTGNSTPLVLNAQLSAANVAPPVTNAEANARGQAQITFNVPRDATTGAITGGGSLTFRVPLLGFPNGTLVVGAHIHTGSPGTGGAILVDTGLTAASGITLANGTGTLLLTSGPITQTDATRLAATPEGFYFNVRTSLNPTGAVRGQLARP